MTAAIACYNEEGNVPRFPQELFLQLDACGAPEWEAVLVDDGSTDATWDALMSVAKGRPNVHLIRHDANRGLGAALKSAFERATGDAIIAIDADLTFHPRDIRRLLDAYDPSVDCVIGSPWLGKLGGVPWRRRLMSWGVNRLYRLVLGVPVTASSSMFRLYRAEAIRMLTLESNAFDISAEILYRLLRAGRKVVEVPVTLSERQVGTSKINVPREIRNHLRLLWRIARG